jgi:hypothetical protein
MTRKRRTEEQFIAVLKDGRQASRRVDVPIVPGTQDVEL